MKVLAIATVSRSLALQSPRQWTILRDLGFELTFAAGEDDYSGHLAELGTFVPITLERSLGLGSSRAILREMRALLTAEQWALVQLQSPIAAAYARMALPRHRPFPVLYIVHGFHFHPDGKRLTNAAAFAAERVFVHRTDHVAVVADWDRGAARRLGYRPDQITLLPGAGVELGAFQPSVARPHDGRRHDGALLFVGDLNDNKDPLAAVRLLVHVRAVLPTATLRIVGDGPLRDACRDLAVQLGVADSVELIRRSDEMPRLMAEADCLISCSKREGLPRVIIEALGSGAGVVALGNRGTRELLGEGGGALLERDADLDAWVRAILAEVDDHGPDRVAARRAHASRWGIEAFTTAYEGLIRSIAPPSIVP